MPSLIETRRGATAVEEQLSDCVITRLHEKDVEEFVYVLSEIKSDTPGFLPDRKELIAGTTSIEKYKRKLKDPNAFLFVAKKAGVIVGVLDGQIEMHPDNPPEYQRVGNTNWVGVSPNYRQQGISADLLSSFESACQMKGIPSMVAYIHNINFPSIIMYTKRGYTQAPSQHFPPTSQGKHYIKSMRRQ